MSPHESPVLSSRPHGAGHFGAEPAPLAVVLHDEPLDPRQRAPLPNASRNAPQDLRGRDDFHVAAAGNQGTAYLTLKRALDIVGAILLLVLLAPVMLTALIVLTITTQGRPIFCQERLGRHGRPFRMLKFRTMILNAADLRDLVQNQQAGPVFKNARDPRVTWIGRILRTTSIDEMPQLFNILAGQMSLVGPRPPLAEEVAQYEPWQRQRLAVKPGLTCLWQVSGRSTIGFDEWVRMDLWYIENQSLATDLGLLLRTPASVLSRRGAY